MRIISDQEKRTVDAKLCLRKMGYFVLGASSPFDLIGVHPRREPLFVRVARERGDDIARIASVCDHFPLASKIELWTPRTEGFVRERWAGYLWRTVDDVASSA